MSSAASAARFEALAEVSRRTPRRVPALDPVTHAASLADTYGCLTFNPSTMRQKLSHETLQALQGTVRRGVPLRREIAAEVAHAMKEWALELGATRFCHWFQPQTGLTAEKHDSFLSFDDGIPIERFSAAQLIQGEPDASSFPSGGMRSTFEARGYTAWDPTSPVFVMEGPNGRTLCIPSVFISWHGKALDRKTPLLRSMEFLGTAAVELLHLLGHPEVDRVVPTVGPEQEFFLVDRAFYRLRPDLVTAGRTLQGAPAPKGQQLEDHYFGSIKPRALAFLQEVEHELYKLGVPVKTRHNEVAPGQFELAPFHEEANVAADHNQLVMEVLRIVAGRHDLVVLLHEKPFAGVNGSGKHVNWSLMDSRGRNLLHPGETWRDALEFLVFMVAVLRGVSRRADLLRAAVATSGNDHRLGAHEAPPAILSVFLGQALERALTAIESGEVAGTVPREDALRLGISRLPEIQRDLTDRNRTSPIAFTGSKFEFRAVPSSAVISTPVAYLNAAVGEALREMTTSIRAGIEAGLSLDAALLAEVQRGSRETRSVRFEGNNYGDDWVREAERRGLPHRRNTPEALAALATPEAKAFFASTGLYDEDELASRWHVKLERYVKDVRIEAATLEELCRTQVLPAAIGFEEDLARALEACRSAGATAGVRRQEVLLGEVADRVELLLERLEALARADAEVQAREADLAAQASLVATALVPALADLREVADALEATVPDHRWPLPRYREMLGIQ